MKIKRLAHALSSTPEFQDDCLLETTGIVFAILEPDFDSSADRHGWDSYLAELPVDYEEELPDLQILHIEHILKQVR